MIIQNQNGRYNITIPKSLVQALGIKTGDQYEFKIGKQGELILKKGF